jgi:hypothetical protein
MKEGRYKILYRKVDILLQLTVFWSEPLLIINSTGEKIPVDIS